MTGARAALLTIGALALVTAASVQPGVALAAAGAIAVGVVLGRWVQ